MTSCRAQRQDFEDPFKSKAEYFQGQSGDAKAASISLDESKAARPERRERQHLEVSLGILYPCRPRANHLFGLWDGPVDCLNSTCIL